jgi:hypothetical protein
MEWCREDSTTDHAEITHGTAPRSSHPCHPRDAWFRFLNPQPLTETRPLWAAVPLG